MDELNDRAWRESLQKQLVLCRAEMQAQNLMIKALIANHPFPEMLGAAFRSFCETSVSRALGSATDDDSIEAFQLFRDRWLEWLPDPQERGPQKPPTT